MKITINLPEDEVMALVMHLGFVGFQMPFLNKNQKEIFRKTAKIILNKVLTFEEQLKMIDDTHSEIIKAIYNYKIPVKKNG